jgi:hypothetical protein
MFETPNIDKNEQELNQEIRKIKKYEINSMKAVTEQKKSAIELPRKHSLISLTRLVAGFILAPLLGTFIYYLLFFMPSAVNYVSSGASLSNSFSYLTAVTLIGGSLFYAPVGIVGLIVMLIIRRYYSWNYVTSIIGAVISAFLVLFLFSILLWAIESEYILSDGGLSLLAALIIIPSVLTGASFWLIALYKNTCWEFTAGGQS